MNLFDMQTLTPIIAVAALTLLGNVIYFNYKFNKVIKAKKNETKITEFLLPIYIIFKTEEFARHRWLKDPNADLAEYYSDMPDRLFVPIKNIIDKNLHLTDSDLQKLSVQFIEWGFREDSYQRFQDLHNGKGIDDSLFFAFRDEIYRQFEKEAKEFSKQL